MAPVDCARWTTTLTASYLAITAALIAILGNGVPFRVGLVAVHLTLSGLLLILNRARPSAGNPSEAPPQTAQKNTSAPLR
jgi:hypothetical protein